MKCVFSIRSPLLYKLKHKLMMIRVFQTWTKMDPLKSKIL